jgi:hypothetical protein
VQTCVPPGRWGECRERIDPTPETCDGLDNDCDDDTDEELVPAEGCRPLGVCAGTQPVCRGAAGWGCEYPSTYEPQETLCDGLDNDCNGDVDDGCTTPWLAFEFVGVALEQGLPDTRVTLRNRGVSEARPLELSFDRGQADVFVLAAGGDCPVGGGLAAGEACSVLLQLTAACSPGTHQALLVASGGGSRAGLELVAHCGPSPQGRLVEGFPVPLGDPFDAVTAVVADGAGGVVIAGHDYVGDASDPVLVPFGPAGAANDASRVLEPGGRQHDSSLFTLRRAPDGAFWGVGDAGVAGPGYSSASDLIVCGLDPDLGLLPSYPSFPGLDESTLYARGLALDLPDRLWVAGSTWSSARYDVQAVLWVLTLGLPGVRTVPLHPGAGLAEAGAAAEGVARDAAGTVWVAGWVDDDTQVPEVRRAAVWATGLDRLEERITPWLASPRCADDTGARSEARSVVVDGGGGVWVAGSLACGVDGARAALWKLGPDGVPLPGFPRLDRQEGATEERAEELALDPSGRVVLVSVAVHLDGGSERHSLVLRMYDARGTRVPGFPFTVASGAANLLLGEQGLAVGSDGAVWLVGRLEGVPVVWLVR